MRKISLILSLVMVLTMCNFVCVDASSVVFSDDFAGGKTNYEYTLYNESVDAEVKATSSGKNNEGEYDVESLEYKGADYEGSVDGGWKVDVTDYVTSGAKLGLKFDYLMDYYDGKVFIEVRNSSGSVVNTFDFSDAPKTTEVWKSYTSSIEPTVTYSAGQTVYLCVKQESGFWFVTNIELSSIGGGSTGGNTGSGEVTSGVVFSDDFAGGKTNYEYTLYDESVDAVVSATAYGKNDNGEYDVPSLQYKGTDYEGSVDGGWKVDVTDYVTSGAKLGLKFDYLMDYYDGKVFIEVRNASGSVVNTFDFSDAPKTTEAWKSYTSSIEPTVTYSAGQTIYLCVKQESGYWFVKNIELSATGGSSDSGNTGGDPGDDTPIVSGSANIIPSDEDITVDDLTWQVYKNDTDTTTSTVSGAQIVKDSANHTVTFTKYNNNFTGKADITDMFKGLGTINKLTLSFHFANTRDGSYAGIMIIDKYGNEFYKTVKKDLGKKEADYTETITTPFKVSNVSHIYLYASPTKNGNIVLSNLNIDVDYETGGQADEDEGWKPVIVSNFSSADSAPAFEPYDETVKADIIVKDTCPDGSGEYNVTGLEYVGYDAEGNDYQGHENGGVKVDITDKIKSGDKLSLSLRYRTEYYDFVPFIEVRSSKGTVKNTFAFDVAGKTDVWVDYKSELTPEVTFTTGDSVYLCIKCQNGFWHFSNIVLTSSDDGTEVEAVDVGKKTIVNESFSGGSSSLTWSLYDSSLSAAVTITSYGPDGGEDGGYSTPCLQYKESNYESNDNAGIKTDVTSLVKNYDSLGLSMGYRSEWYNVHPFIEVVGANGAVKGTFAFASAEKGGENCGWSTYTSAVNPEITFEKGDKVFFCIKSAGGYWHVKDIVLTRSAFTGIKWTSANLTTTDTTATVSAVVYNYGYEDETVDLIVCAYDGTTLKSVAVETIPAYARQDSEEKSVSVDYAAGNTVKAFIWDADTMDEYDSAQEW